MPTKISAIETLVRQRLNEPVASFWSSTELTELIISGIRDLWRDVVDLKQEHYLRRNITDVTFQANSISLSGVPTDVHKVYMLEPVNPTSSSSNAGLYFKPQEYNNKDFIGARTMDAIDPTNAVIYYAVTGTGAPVEAPTIYCAPKVTSAVAIAFTYVPALGALTTDNFVPIPGEADNALVAWAVSYARAKERETRDPDPGWLSIYATEKLHLLQSLGLREYQEPKLVQAIFEDYWG